MEKEEKMRPSVPNRKCITLERSQRKDLGLKIKRLELVPRLSLFLFFAHPRCVTPRGRAIVAVSTD